MSVAGYFSNTTELRMPKGEDVLGIRFEGEVLNGEKSVEDRRRADAISATAHIRPGDTYRSAKDYDPVLRAHCRL